MNFCSYCPDLLYHWISSKSFVNRDRQFEVCNILRPAVDSIYVGPYLKPQSLFCEIRGESTIHIHSNFVPYNLKCQNTACQKQQLGYTLVNELRAVGCLYSLAPTGIVTTFKVPDAGCPANTSAMLAVLPTITAYQTARCEYNIVCWKNNLVHQPCSASQAQIYWLSYSLLCQLNHASWTKVPCVLMISWTFDIYHTVDHRSVVWLSVKNTQQSRNSGQCTCSASVLVIRTGNWGEKKDEWKME